MKPPRAPAHAQTGLVQMLHPRLACRQVLYVRRRAPQTRRSPPAHRRQRRRRHPRAEQHRHDLRQAGLRQELRMTQPDRRIGKPPTVLRRGRHAGRERRPRHLTATPAATRMTPMLRDLQRARLRQVEYLARDRIDRPATPTTATPRSPGRTTEHAPPHGPGWPSGTASCPCAPPDRPACDPSCPSGYGFDAPPLASSDRRSTAAGRCCGCSGQDDAPTPKSAQQNARSDPAARRSPTPDARSSPRVSRTGTPAKHHATVWNHSWRG